MPFCFKEQMADMTLALWKITESEEALRSYVLESDMRSVEGFTSETRRKERLAWRALLRRFIPEGEVLYDEHGAPRVKGSDLYIGVSHTPGMAALVFSSRPCAVDIERESRDPEKLVTRYLAEEELRLPESGTPLFRIAAWCAKETLYKISGRKALDLREKIRITAYRWTSMSPENQIGVVAGCVDGEAQREMRMLLQEGCVIVHTL